MTHSGSVRTSASHPIDVSWLPVSTPGRVGLTLAPGKHAPSSLGAPWKRSLSDDLDRLAGHHAVRVLVCLLEDHEFVSLKIPGLVSEAKERSIDVVRLPIVDGGIPTAIAPLVELVMRIREASAEGRNVAIHCKAGLGRSGVVGGSVLIAEGKTARQAISILNEMRSPDSPENAAQKRFLKAVEGHFNASGRSPA